MKVLFIGSVSFSEKALQKFISLDVNVVGVVTKRSSSFNADFADLSGLAETQNIDYHYTKNINEPDSVGWIQKKQADVIFCLGWSQLLKQNILDIPPQGVVGYHPTELPNNRGRHPLIWAMVLGLEKTASTFFVMNKGADTGDIISQETFPIYFEDEAMDVYNRMIDTATGQLEEIVTQFKAGEVQRESQDIKAGNSWRKRGKQDGKIDFRMSTKPIYNLVRALSEPYVGAHIEWQDQEIKVWETRISTDYYPQNIEPGKVLRVSDQSTITVKTQDGAIILSDHEFNHYPMLGSYL
jgi:methionyl-tRNA formyltransferase